MNQLDFRSCMTLAITLIGCSNEGELIQTVIHVKVPKTSGLYFKALLFKAHLAQHHESVLPKLKSLHDIFVIR